MTSPRSIRESVKPTRRPGGEWNYVVVLVRISDPAMSWAFRPRLDAGRTTLTRDDFVLTYSSQLDCCETLSGFSVHLATTPNVRFATLGCGMEPLCGSPTSRTMVTSPRSIRESVKPTRRPGGEWNYVVVLVRISDPAMSWAFRPRLDARRTTLTRDDFVLTYSSQLDCCETLSGLSGFSVHLATTPNVRFATLGCGMEPLCGSQTSRTMVTSPRNTRESVKPYAPSGRGMELRCGSGSDFRSSDVVGVPAPSRRSANNVDAR